MTPTSTNIDQVLAFCSKLPGIPGELTHAKADARATLDFFGQRRGEIDVAITGASSDPQELALLRCELEALESARRVVCEIWQRRFGAPLPNR
jgi:hypothetical protein